MTLSYAQIYYFSIDNNGNWPAYIMCLICIEKMFNIWKGMNINFCTQWYYTDHMCDS